MKLKNLSTTLALGSALVAGNAAAIIVGGVDFGAIGDPPGTHLETTTLAETFIDGNGQTIMGYGQVNTVNGDITYAVNPADRLYFVFDNYVAQNFTPIPVPGTVEFSGGVIDFFIGPDFNLLNQNSPTNVGIIQGYTPWVRATGHGNLGGGATANATLSADGTLTGASISFTGEGLGDIAAGFGIQAVIDFLNSNGIPDAIGGLADVAITTSGNNTVPNINDINDGLCTQPVPQQGDWCIQGSADVRGLTGVQQVPEPSIMVLMGMGLLGAGAVSLRRKARKA